MQRLLLIHRPQPDPCEGAPTLSIGAQPSIADNGTCDPEIDPMTVTTTVNISAALPTGMKIQYRFVWGTTSGADPSGGWTDWSGYTGTSDDLVHAPDPDRVKAVSGGTTYYYKAEFRLVGTDDVTVCDGPDLTNQLTCTNMDTCFA